LKLFGLIAGGTLNLHKCVMEVMSSCDESARQMMDKAVRRQLDLSGFTCRDTEVLEELTEETTTSIEEVEDEDDEDEDEEMEETTTETVDGTTMAEADSTTLSALFI
jgi:replicative DNA helicase